MMVKIQVGVFWVETPWSVVVGQQCFGGPRCLHLQDEVSCDRKNAEGPLKLWNPTITLHGVTTW